MEFDNVGDSVAVVHRLLVGEVELDGDAKVAAEDDDGGHDQVEEEYGDHEREGLVLHLPPGQRAGQAKGLGAVSTPAHYGEQSPDQSIEPGPQAQHLHLLPADFLPCSGGKKKKVAFSFQLAVHRSFMNAQGNEGGTNVHG